MEQTRIGPISKKMEYKQAFESFTQSHSVRSEAGEAYYNRANSWYQLPSDAYPNHDGCLDLKNLQGTRF